MPVKDIILIVVFVLVVIFLWNFFKQEKVPKNTVLALTGSLGQGKSFIGVKEAIKHHNKMRLLYMLGVIKEKPIFYSNIPVYLGRTFIIFGKKRWTEMLTFNMVIGVDRQSQYCTVFIDELGQFADQYSFNNPFVMQYIQRYMRLFRHWTDGKLIWTDQASDNVVKPLRSRTNVIYNLSNFRRWWLLFYKVDVQRVTMIEDVITMDEVTSGEDLPYFFGILPFKYFTFLNKVLFFIMPPKYYDSRCYSETYLATDNYKSMYFKKYKTEDYLQLPNFREMKQIYKTNGRISLKQAEYFLEEHKELIENEKKVLKQINKEDKTD